MALSSKCLCEHISYHVLRRAIPLVNHFIFNLLTIEMVLHINVLCASTLLGVLGKCNAPLIVTHDGGGLLLHAPYISHELSKPNGLLG